MLEVRKDLLEHSVHRGKWMMVSTLICKEQNAVHVLISSKSYSICVLHQGKTLKHSEYSECPTPFPYVQSSTARPFISELHVTEPSRSSRACAVYSAAGFVIQFGWVMPRARKGRSRGDYRGSQGKLGCWVTETNREDTGGVQGRHRYSFITTN